MVEIIVLLILIYFGINKYLNVKKGKLILKRDKLKKENEELKTKNELEEGKKEAEKEAQKKMKDFLQKLQEIQGQTQQITPEMEIKIKQMETIKKELAQESALMDFEQLKKMALTAPNKSIDHFIDKLYKKNPDKTN